MLRGWRGSARPRIFQCGCSKALRRIYAIRGTRRVFFSHHVIFTSFVYHIYLYILIWKRRVPIYVLSHTRLPFRDSLTALPLFRKSSLSLFLSSGVPKWRKCPSPLGRSSRVWRDDIHKEPMNQHRLSRASARFNFHRMPSGYRNGNHIPNILCKLYSGILCSE